MERRVREGPGTAVVKSRAGRKERSTVSDYDGDGYKQGTEV